MLRHDRYDDHASPVISQNGGELGWVIWLVITVQGAMDRLVNGRSSIANQLRQL